MMTAGMIILGVFGLALLILSARSFMEKGAPFMTTYWVATPIERERLKSKEIYRYLGWVFLWASIALFAGVLHLWQRATWTLILFWSILIVMLVYAIVKWMRMLTRNKV